MKAKEQKEYCTCKQTKETKNKNFLCLICGKMHLNPFAKISKEKRMENARKAALSSWKNRNSYLYCEKMRRAIDRDKQRIAVSKSTKKEWKINKEKRSKSVSNGVKRYFKDPKNKEVISKRQTERARKLWNNENSVNKFLEKRKSSWFAGNRYSYKGKEFRSTYEIRLAYCLDYLGYFWNYEKKWLTFSLDGKKRKYLPDFYLPELDLWVEVGGYISEEKIKKIETVKIQNNLNIILVNNIILKCFGLGNSLITFSNSDNFPKLFYANTEPSDFRNKIEGVETTIENLRKCFISMVSKLQERPLVEYIFDERYSPNLLETLGSGDKELHV